jgi:hypothetical protein
VRVILHGRAGGGVDFDEVPGVLLVQSPEDAPLDRFEAVAQVGNGAVADDVRSVLEKVAIHAPVQGRFDLARHERPGRGGGDRFGLDVLFVLAVAVALRLRLGGVNGQFRLWRRILAFGCHNYMSRTPYPSRAGRVNWHPSGFMEAGALHFCSTTGRLSQ